MTFSFIARARATGLILLATLAGVSCAEGSTPTGPTDGAPTGTATSSGVGTGAGSGGGPTTTAEASSSSSTGGSGPTGPGAGGGPGGGGSGSGAGGAGASAGGSGGGGGCGDGIVGAGEDCDGTDLGGASCTTIGQGFVGGTLACSPSCTFDTSGCQASPTCGNGTVDPGEDCDGANLDGQTCVTIGESAGTLGCTAGCTFDLTGCYTCGDGDINGPEVCDTANLGGKTCASLGHAGGTLACASGCLSFNETGCTDCGNGVRGGTEQCDGADLGGNTCMTLGYTGGTLSCSSSCTFVTTSCTNSTCGDGVRQGAEVCDGSDFGGLTCASYGFTGGSLICSGCIQILTTSCTTTTSSQCGDGLDNDGDGNVDLADPGCTSASDNDESIYADNCNGIGGPIYDVTLAGGVDVVVTGSTAGVNHFGPTDHTVCTTANGPEIVLFYRLYQTMNGVHITTDRPGTTFDTVLYVRQTTCGPSAVEICDDDGGAVYNTLSSDLYLNMPAGDYFIFIDGYAGASGNYELLIDLP